jgi:peptidoglycan lytic transglycosylase G
VTRGSRTRRRSVRGSSTRSTRRKWLALLSLLTLVALTVAAGVWFWTRRGGPPSDGIELDLRADASVDEIGRELEDRGALEDAWLFSLYLKLSGAGGKVKPGPHLLRRGLTPAALAARLTRSSARPIVKLTIPEGYNRFQVAERLQALDIARADTFLLASIDAQLLASLEIVGASAEGYLFPATYELYVDSEATSVLRSLVQESTRRFRRVSERHAADLARRPGAAGFGKHELLTLASIVEKEAASPKEHGRIASVFYNRLEDPRFLPRRMLQSDPTAGYGCLLAGERLPSCRGYTGTVTASMLRDPDNEYNTYKHPGLPPGPIANPSQSALEAVFDPPDTPYFFFVAGPAKRHVFSRTLAEHEQAITQSARRGSGAASDDQRADDGDAHKAAADADALRSPP